ncbi:hypothetical protein [Ralstonia pseudosolanacearum]
MHILLIGCNIDDRPHHRGPPGSEVGMLKVGRMGWGGALALHGGEGMGVSLPAEPEAVPKPTCITTQVDLEHPGLTNGAQSASRSLREMIDVERLAREPGKFQYKWDMSVNGTFIIGNIHVPKPSGKGLHHLGHPTLVGGRKIPQARISGMLYADAMGCLVINNDSG